MGDVDGHGPSSPLLAVATLLRFSGVERRGGVN